MSVSHGQQQKQTQKHETAHAQKTRGLKVTLSCHVRTPEGFHYLPQEGKKIHRTLKQKPKQIDFFLASWHLKAGSLIPAIIAGETLTKTHTHTHRRIHLQVQDGCKNTTLRNICICQRPHVLLPQLCESALLEDLQENCPSVKINA